MILILELSKQLTLVVLLTARVMTAVALPTSIKYSVIEVTHLWIKITGI